MNQKSFTECLERIMFIRYITIIIKGKFVLYIGVDRLYDGSPSITVFVLQSLTDMTVFKFKCRLRRLKK